MNNQFSNELNKELAGFSDVGEFLKYKGFTTPEEGDAYCESKRQYTFEINYDSVKHRRVFENKIEADIFEGNFLKWKGWMHRLL